MDVQSLFQLINPLAFLLFAGGFFGLYFAARTQRAAALFGVSYVIGAAAFTADFFRAALPDMFASFLTNALYTVTSATFAAAMAVRYRGRIPVGMLAAAAIGGFGAYVALYFAEPDIYLRSVAINFANAVVLSIGVFAMRDRVRRPIDAVIFAINVLFAAQCVARPLAVGWLQTDPLSVETYTHSLFYLSLHLVVGVLAIAMAMALLVAFGLEVIEDLGRRSVTDGLSGVLNRRGFEEAAEEMFHRDAAGVSVILADIDRFKAINDTHGHAFGDEVIAQMGALFRAYSNAGRVAGRIGGEEFAMLAPGLRLVDGVNIAEAMRRKFSVMKFESLHGDLAFTASFGVAVRQPGETLFDALARADEALYLAKEEGRDRVKTEEDVCVARLDGALERLERRQFRRGKHSNAARA